MLTEPLPSKLDLRKMAVRGTEIKGYVALADLPRIVSLLASSDGSIEATCRFYRDEENRPLASVAVSAELEVSCQRCLEPTRIGVSTDSTLCIIAGEEQESSVPANLEPLILDDGMTDLWSVVEDELLLGLPIVSYHDSGPCADLIDQYQSGTEPEELEQKHNPFEVLQQLKTD